LSSKLDNVINWKVVHDV